MDSGLVAATQEDGQAALLVPSKLLEELGVPAGREHAFSRVPGLAIGNASREEAPTMRVRGQVWRSFGDWGGIDVAALVSWGFLRHFTWTIDFERRRYLLPGALRSWLPAGPPR